MNSKFALGPLLFCRSRFKMARLLSNFMLHRISHGIFFRKISSRPQCDMKLEDHVMENQSEIISSSDLNDNDDEDDESIHSYFNNRKPITEADLNFPWEVNLNSEQQGKFKLIKHEYLIWRTADDKIPDPIDISEDVWMQMLAQDVDIYRIAILTFCRRKNNLKNKHKRITAENSQKIELRRQKAREEAQKLYDPQLKYAYGYNYLFQRMEHTKIMNWKLARTHLIQQLQPTVIFDLGLLKHLSQPSDINLTCRQLFMAYLENNSHRSPFNLLLANVDRRANYFPRLRQHFEKSGGPNLDSLIFTDLTAESVVDASRHLRLPQDDDAQPSRRQLVYLSPDADRTLTRFDANAIYVVGAMVDRSKYLRNVSLSEAKQIDVTAMKLPLNVYLDWQTGHKALALNHVMKVLLDVHMTGNFRAALESTIPMRRLIPSTHDKAERLRCVRESRKERLRFLVSLTRPDGANMDDCYDDRLKIGKFE